jgi:hypothetical protein
VQTPLWGGTGGPFKPHFGLSGALPTHDAFFGEIACAIFMALCNNRSMKEDSVRTTVDIPRPLYRKLKQQAAAKGSSVRELVLSGVKTVLLQGQRPRSKRVRFPLIVSKGPKVNVTNEGIYEYIEFP